MDEAVKMRVTLSAGLALFLAAGMALAAAPSASGLPDPTRPPATTTAAPGGVDAAPQLQSVLLGAARGQDRIAVIDGESVRVGEQFRGARVVRIADNEVELQRGAERQVLRLYAPDGGANGMTRVAPAARRP